MSREERDNPEVLIIRAGYASERLWWEAILAAQDHGRPVAIIDAEGRRQCLT